MRLLASLLIALPACVPAAVLPYYSVVSGDPAAWPDVFSSVGVELRSALEAGILVARAGAPNAPDWPARVDSGAILVLEGESPLATNFGFHAGKARVRVTSLVDVHRPTMPITWERPVDLAVFSVPDGARIFARERWSGAPMVAGLKRGAGAVLWIAAPPGEKGYERFPYLLATLADLGLDPPFRSSRLWAFFDSSYRLRVDLDYFAARWRRSGIAALHVAAWQYYDADPERDAYLAKLIETCHREGILVYAWLELPHVSGKFWNDHPEWREKTGVLQDAQLDWRKLMNLANPDCFRTVANGVGQLINRFDWDGVNLAELYFESLEGVGNPSRFTPMNGDVRADFHRLNGFDPIEIFGKRNDENSRRIFLEYRVGLARRIQEQWLTELESLRKPKPHLDLVLTHVDDRFDTSMRDSIGADASRVLPLLGQHRFTFLIEDPATIWNLGPQRYHTIADRYRALTNKTENLAIDLNIVDRYQDVYPTRQQTGTELFQLVHNASANFPRVALYFENSLLPPDLPFLSSAASAATRSQQPEAKTLVNSIAGVGLPWKGAATVDDQPWPVSDGETLWLPPGPHVVAAAQESAAARLLYLNAELKSARTVSSETVEFRYQSGPRALAIFNRPPRRVQIDGVESKAMSGGPTTLLLPPGEHLVLATVN